MQDWHNDIDNNDTQLNGRGVNVWMLRDLDTTNPGIQENKEKKEVTNEGNLALDTQEGNLLKKLHTLAIQEGDLLERLAIVRSNQTRNDGARKRKHSSDNEDMKPSTPKP